jgi:S-DNA-T family DNA segregation ATPase FtsK/SpoIIIE
MIGEIISTVVFGSIAASSYYANKVGGGSDHPKIERIAANCGLSNREGKKVRIHRRTKKKGYTEYVYQMPEGLAAKDFQDKLANFQDGLNIKRSLLDLSLADLKGIKLRGDIVKQVKTLLAKKKETPQRGGNQLRWNAYLSRV